MTKAKMVLSVVGILTAVAGALSFKAQHKLLGTFFCTGLYTLVSTKKYATVYTTFNANVTLWCTKNAGSLATTTTKVVKNP